MYLCPQVQLSTLPPEPVIPSKKPFRVELVGGKRYSWCTCGHSKKQVKAHLASSHVAPVWGTHPVFFPWSHPHLSAFLRRSPQNQSPRPVPAALCPWKRHHGLAVRLQVHKQPALLRRHAQAGLRGICPAAQTCGLLKRKAEVSLNWASALLLRSMKADGPRRLFECLVSISPQPSA